MDRDKQAIVVGLLLDQSDERLLQIANVFARSWNTPIEIVHAIPPTFHFLNSGEGARNKFCMHEMHIRENEEADALMKMKDLASRSKVPINLHIVRDNPPEALLAVASEVRARLLICGVQIPVSQRVFHGFSTAFGIAAEAEIPVLILPLQAKLDFDPPRNILVADNLDLEGRCALEWALQISKDLEVGSIHHVYVHRVNEAKINKMMMIIKEGMAIGQIPNDPLFTKDSYLESVVLRTKEDLNYRFQNSPGVKAFQGDYQARVAFGHPAVELQRIAAETRSQIIIFGRHHALKNHKHTVSRIPFHAMINNAAATLIVPDLERPPIVH